MFEGFFILVGGFALSIVEFFKNLSLDNLKADNVRDNEIDTTIFSKLNLELEPQALAKQESRFDEIRDALLKYLLNRHVIFILLIIGLGVMLFAGLELFGIYLVVIAMTYLFILSYPKIKEERSYSDLNQELPYALRHMGVELKSGKGLHDALITIRDANYGSLSNEFTRVLEEVKFGKSTEDSLIEMSHRVRSDGLSRAVHQIISTLRVGGNLANSLEIIAQDISFDMQIRLKEYSQKLNSFILIYTFIAILAPVISLIMLMAGSTVMGDVISSELIFVIYTVFFPLIVVFMGLFIKKMEPKI
ncbi:MAG: type II secretion system F family protein [Methanobrevibacter thaueri]|jgi:flagellar protein FlaJ|uniref:type II secretion system F family protein n=1 Tax=Methanobrevibacter thaueri TaxID=190975 RepID=UPI0026EC8413|nr:type II secretion system F family protein [Methanobrevibacter thaueri]MBE6495120.1 type II secretion system F family protein [Methanobrevibacter thaueri]